MTVDVLDIKLKDGSLYENEDAPIRFDVDVKSGNASSIEEEISWKLHEEYNIDAKSFTWYEASPFEEIKGVLRKYFEGNDEYDPYFSAQDAIDEIVDFVGF